MKNLMALGALGFFLGPAVDAIHNQVLLDYSILPVKVQTYFGTATTSIIVPPLLSVAYCLLGVILPDAVKRIVGTASVETPLSITNIASSQRAFLAICSTVAIVRTSALLAGANNAAGAAPLFLLSAMALAQWLVLDASAASLALAAAAAVLGPIAEIPFMAAGAWHYTRPDYWPLTPFGLGPESGAGWAGLSSLTGPCYFAVTTDAVALGRWLLDLERAPSHAPGPGPPADADSDGHRHADSDGQ